MDIGVDGMVAGIGDGVLAPGGIVRGNAAATGATPTGSAALVRTRGVWGAAASLSSRRRNKPRSNPANFVFTLFDMTLVLHFTRCPSQLTDSLVLAGSTPTVVFDSTSLPASLKVVESAGPAGNLSQRWTPLSLVCSHCGI
jgi:hypothetical protein